jgi:hypothetical protein
MYAKTARYFSVSSSFLDTGRSLQRTADSIFGVGLHLERLYSMALSSNLFQPWGPCLPLQEKRFLNNFYQWETNFLTMSQRVRLLSVNESGQSNDYAVQIARVLHKVCQTKSIQRVCLLHQSDLFNKRR